MDDIHLLIVGVIYVLSSIPIYLKNRENRYDRGFQWIIFSMAHGIDEIADYLAGLTNSDELHTIHIFLEKVELATFFLAGAFLFLAALVKMGKIDSNQSLSVSTLLLLIALFFMVLDENALDAIKSLNISIAGFEFKYITIFFGLFAAIPLIILYFYEFTVLAIKTFKIRNFDKRKIFNSLNIAILFILYIIGELFAPYYIYLVYLEVFTILYIMLTPLEILLDNNIQIFLVYDQGGMLVYDAKFNTKISDDMAVLVSGFLSAINSLAKNELKIGNLDKINTEQGYLVSEYREKYTFAILINEDKLPTLERFKKLIPMIEEKLPENYEGMIDNISELDNLVLNTLVA